MSITNFEILQDSSKAERIRFLLYSPAWQEDFAPEFQALKAAAITLLRNPSLARQAQVSDDYLRARLDILDELLLAGHAFLAEYDANRQQEEEARQRQFDYQARADTGQFAPMYPASGY